MSAKLLQTRSDRSDVACGVLKSNCWEVPGKQRGHARVLLVSGVSPAFYLAPGFSAAWHISTLVVFRAIRPLGRASL
jgi:hypothetical protein